MYLNRKEWFMIAALNEKGKEFGEYNGDIYCIVSIPHEKSYLVLNLENHDESFLLTGDFRKYFEELDKDQFAFDYKC
jgi:hypothetical protein